jgi:hypothetical protein
MPRSSVVPLLLGLFGSSVASPAYQPWSPCDSWKYNPNITKEITESGGFRRHVYVQEGYLDEVMVSPFDTIVVSFGLYRNWTAAQHPKTPQQKKEEEQRKKHIDPFKPYFHFHKLKLTRHWVAKLRAKKKNAKLLLSLGGGDNGQTGKIMPRVFTKLYWEWRKYATCASELQKDCAPCTDKITCDKCAQAHTSDLTTPAYAGAQASCTVKEVKELCAASSPGDVNCTASVCPLADKLIIDRWVAVMVEFINGRSVPGMHSGRNRTVEQGQGVVFDGEY